MIARTRFVLAMALAAFSVAGTATSAAAQQRGRTRVNVRSDRSDGYRSRIDTTIAFDRNGTVTVNAGTGDVFVTGVQGNQLHVRAVSDDDDIRFDFEASRSSIQLST